MKLVIRTSLLEDIKSPDILRVRLVEEGKSDSVVNRLEALLLKNSPTNTTTETNESNQSPAKK